MENKGLMRWSKLRNLPVTIPTEGITIGIVEDFYFKPGTNAIYALRVRLRLLGDRSLPVTGIKSIESDAITIPSAEMLIERLPPFPLGHSLLNRKILSESNKEIGVISEVLLTTQPLAAMRIAGFEMTDLAGRHNAHPRMFGADAVNSYGEEDTIVIADAVAKGLR